MAVSPEFEAWVIDQLAAFGPVRPRRMFGGVGLYHEEVMFGLIMGGDEGVYLKVSDETRPDYLALGSKPFQPYDEGASMSYFEVPPEILEDEERLAEWARRAFDVAWATKRKKPARKKKAAPRKAPAKQAASRKGPRKKTGTKKR